jgi:hypothetical protein
MIPTGTVEKTALDSFVAVVRKLWSWHTDVVKENKSRKEEIAVLKERLDVKAEFERRKAELTSKQEDDNLYCDANGTYYCPYCLNADSKFVPVVNHFEGSYFCSLHKQVFETEARRVRDRNRQQPRQPTYGGPQSWMR